MTERTEAPITDRNSQFLTKPLSVILIILLAIHIICIILLASVPPISRDALIHHLTIPKLYLAAGKIYEIPSMFFSYYPMNLDLLYIIPLYLNFDIGSKYIHFMFALGTAYLTAKYLNTHLGRLYGLAGALLLLTTPIIIKLSVTAYVDLGLIFFTWGALYYVLKWYDSHFQLSCLVLAGIFCGLALGTKYNGLILLLILATFVPLLYSTSQNRMIPGKKNQLRRYGNSLKGISYSVAIVAIALSIFSPWMIRNTIWTGNPIYPLYNSVFNPPKTEAVLEEKALKTAKEKEPQNSFWMRRHVYNESLAQSLLIPVRMFFEGRDDNPKYFDGKLNPYLLLLPILSFVYASKNLSRRLRAHRNFLLGFVILYTLFVLFKADFRIRYMSPALPPLVVLSTMGVYNLIGIIRDTRALTKRFLSVFFGAFLSIAIFYNVGYLYSQFNIIRPFSYLLKQVTRDTYISNYRPEYEVLARANEILPEDAIVMCLSIGDRTYYLNRNVLLAENLHRRENGFISEDIIRERVSASGATHIILGKNYFSSWLRHQPKDLQAAFINFFNNHTTNLYQANGVLLLEYQDYIE